MPSALEVQRLQQKQPPVAAQSGHDQQLLDLLAEAISGTLRQPAPTAPQPPGFQPLSPVQAGAAVTNPQLANLFIQQAQAPAQGQYAQEQAQFEAAMQGRQHALGTGVALAGQQATMQRGELDRQLRALYEGGTLQQREFANQIALLRAQNEANKPESTGNITVGTGSQGQSVLIDKRTGRATDVTTLGGGRLVKPPNIEQEQFKRSSAVLKLRVQQARDMIEGGGTRASRIPQAIVGADPTGIFSGSDYAANATTYRSFITEIASLTRTLYGAQGIRSYQEIVRLINAMPPWTSGPKRIREQFDKLNDAIRVADNEMRAIRPDLMGETPASTSSHKSLGEMTTEELQALRQQLSGAQ